MASFYLSGSYFIEMSESEDHFIPDTNNKVPTTNTIE